MVLSQTQTQNVLQNFSRDHEKPPWRREGHTQCSRTSLISTPKLSSWWAWSCAPVGGHGGGLLALLLKYVSNAFTNPWLRVDRDALQLRHGSQYKWAIFVPFFFWPRIFCSSPGGPKPYIFTQARWPLKSGGQILLSASATRIPVNSPKPVPAPQVGVFRGCKLKLIKPMEVLQCECSCLPSG